MKIGLLTAEGLTYTEKVIDLPKLANFNLLFDYLENIHPELYREILPKRMKICFLKDLNSEPILWTPEVHFENLQSYEYLIFIEDANGEAIITTTMVLSLSIALTGTLVMGATMAAVVAAVINMAIMMAISFVIGKIMEALSPSQNSQEAQNSYKKSLIFSEQEQITTQGSPIPWVLGSCMCQGVIIGREIGTYDWVSGVDGTNPALPDGIPTVTKALIASTPESVWYKLIP